MLTDEVQALVERLLQSRNPDGGWPYHRGSSWAEPTALATLALQSFSAPTENQALNGGIRWLMNSQSSSGGWAPNARVSECTSVTSLAALALMTQPTTSSKRNLDAALNWTAGQVYRDDHSLGLLLARAFNVPPTRAPGSVPWFPGTAGWVTPTALSALTLLKAARRRNQSRFRDTALQSCSYLAGRTCVDGGWNHGGSSTRSEDASSYPETTGLALLALRAANLSPRTDSLALARTFAAAPQSIEGLAWLQMALQTPDHPIPDPRAMPAIRTNRDAALRLLCLRSSQTGKNPFLD